MKKIAGVVFAIVMAVVSVHSGIMSEAATGSKVILYGIHIDELKGHSTQCSWMPKAERFYKTHDSTAVVVKKHHIKASYVHNGLQNNNYVMIQTHGNSNGISVKSAKGEKTRLTVDEIINEPAFTKLKVCHVGACNSAKVAQAIQLRGGKSVIGYTQVTHSASLRKVNVFFNKYFTSGQSVTKAMYNAKAKVYKDLLGYYGIDSYVIYGQMTQTF